jgi:hypothetical protein
LIVDTSGEEVYRYVGRDFADRPDEDDLLGVVDALGLPATTQEPPVLDEPQPGETAARLEALGPYFSGARLAVYALRQRHRHLGDEFTDDAKAYGLMAERYRKALAAVEARKT